MKDEIWYEILDKTLDQVFDQILDQLFELQNFCHLVYTWLGGQRLSIGGCTGLAWI